MNTRQKLFTAFSLLLLASTLFAAALSAAAQTKKPAPRPGGNDRPNGTPRSLVGVTITNAAATLREAENKVRIGLVWNITANPGNEITVEQIDLIVNVRRNTGAVQKVFRDVPVNRTAEIVDLPNLVGFFNAPPTFITKVDIRLNAQFVDRGNQQVFILGDSRTLEVAPPSNAPPANPGPQASDVSLEITELPNPTFVLTAPGQADLRVAWAVGLNPKDTRVNGFQVNFNVRLADGRSLGKTVAVNDVRARQAAVAVNLPQIGDGGFIPITAIKATVVGKFLQRGVGVFEKTAQRTLNLKGKKS